MTTKTEITVLEASRRYGKLVQTIQLLLSSGRMPGRQDQTGRKRWMINLEEGDAFARAKGWTIHE